MKRIQDHEAVEVEDTQNDTTTASVASLAIKTGRRTTVCGSVRFYVAVVRSLKLLTLFET